MKSITKIILLAFAFFVHSNICAEEAFYGNKEFSFTQRGNTSVYGSTIANNTQFENLTIMGNLKYNKLKITESLTINGRLDGELLDCDRLVLNGLLKGHRIIIRDSATINGSIDANDLDIHGVLTMKQSKNGPFIARKSNFEKIVIHGKKVEMAECIIDSIIFEENKNPSELHLSGNSLVKGDVIFKSGNGKVFKSSDSKIAGKVEGGKVIPLP